MRRLKKKGCFVLIVSAVKLVALVFLTHCLNHTSVAAQSPDVESLRETEQWVEEQIKKGEPADLEQREQKKISADFLSKLIKTYSPQGIASSYGLRISHAEIFGDLDLYEAIVPFTTHLESCIFKGAVEFSRSEFQKNLSLKNSKFEGSSNFYEMKVNGDFRVKEAKFLNKKEKTNFDGINVGGTVNFHKTEFEGPFVLRDAIMNRLDCTDAEFRNNDEKSREENANFNRVKVNNGAYCYNASFAGGATFENIDIAKDFDLTGTRFNNTSQTINLFGMQVGGNAIFNKATFSGGLDMTKANITGSLEFAETKAETPTLPKNFTGMRADIAVFDDAVLAPPYWFNGNVYRIISANSEEQLKTLIDKSEYESPDAYTNLESYFRRMGFQDAADDVYIAGRVRERNEGLRKQGLAYLPKYLWSWLLHITVGYGKYVSRAVLWSILLIVTGYLVFRKEEYMMTQRTEDKARYKGKYNPLWYSIALFLPIVNLEDSQVWTPKMNRKKSRLYMRLHMILGYLLIPIGLAAWTGLIK